MILVWNKDLRATSNLLGLLAHRKWTLFQYDFILQSTSVTDGERKSEFKLT